MKNALCLCRALSAVFIFTAAPMLRALVAVPSIPNPSFESNGASFTNSPGYIGGNTTITGWTASDPSRVGINSSTGPFQDNGTIPQGSYVAFVQSVGPAVTLSNTITGLTIGVTYQVQFAANRRGVYGAPNPTLKLNGGTAVPFSVDPAGYRTFSAYFTATANTAALVISNTPDPAGFQDATMLLDNFTITPLAAGPINFVVTNTLDNGLGSLRRALNDAAAHAGPDTITFASGLSGTIALASELAVSDPDGATVDASNVSLTLSGGGTHRIFNFSNATGSFSLKNLTFIDGSSSLGGAIYGAGPLTLANCSFSGNTATTAGGAVIAQTSLSATGCTFSGNSCQGAGGAVMVSATTPLSSIFTSCTFTGNQAQDGGGAITDNVGDEVVVITQCTIAGNGCTNLVGGAGLDFSYTTSATISYSILAGNFSFNGVELRNYGSASLAFPPLKANLYNLSDDAPSGFTGTDIVNSTTIGLGSLQNNGGPTQTMAIGPGSPAFDGAGGSLYPRVTTDQRGLPVQSVPDIGAYESQLSGISLSAASYTAVAGYPLIVTVHRGGNQSGSATVRLLTTAGTAPATAFTARPDTTASDVVFSDGEADKDIAINMAKSTVAADKTFSLSLGTPTATGPIATGTPSSATVTIKTPVTLQVTSINDDGPGSLRQMLAAAASTPAYNVITFAPALNGKIITLGSQIVITDTVGVTIDASSLPLGITIDGAGYSRLFNAHITGSTFPRFALLGLTLSGGNTAGSGGGDGGAISDTGYWLELTRCTVANNFAAVHGGGVDSGGSPVFCTQCTFSGNIAGVGTGAGGISTDVGSSLSCNECTFAGNIAPNPAGGTQGFCAGFNTSTGRFVHCTFAANLGSVSGHGVGIKLFESHLTLTDCILANNGSDIVVTQTPSLITLVGTNIIQVIADAGGNPLSSSAVNGTGTRLTSDPKLDDLASNGGPTQTVALLAGSPAINAATGPAVTADQRGLPIVGAADIGAFEVQKGGIFILDQGAYRVAENAGPLTVSILRLVNFSGPASVTINTVPGTAGAADFTSVNQVVNFADGEASKTVTIVINNGSVVTPDKTFTIKLSKPSAGSSLGALTSATAVILNTATGGSPDTTAPGIPVITSPAASAQIGVPTGGVVFLTGTATDNKGVDFVVIRDASLNFVADATMAAPGAPSTTWRAFVTPVTGVNTFHVQTSDFQMNESVSVARTFTVLRPLVVNISGNGTVTSGYAPNSYRQVGKPQTVTATVGAGYLFNGWTILSSHTAASIGASSLSLPTLSFIDQEGLALRATFVPSPYTTANTGVFNGGIDPSPSIPIGGTAATLSTVGYVSATVQTSGAFTAALKLDGTSYAVAGSFDAGGTAHFGTSRASAFTVVRSGLPALFVTLGINTGTGIISGVVSTFDGASITASSTITAERCPYNVSHLVPASQLGPVNADALYTIILPAIASQALGNANYPQGSGYASMKLTKYGVITVSGVLADGTPFTEATTFAATQHWRLFASLYGNKGLVAGNAAFGVSNFDFLAMGSTWIRPVMDSQYYPGGWAGGILFNVAGAKYTVTAGHSVVPGLDQAGDAELDFSDAGITSTVEDLFTLSAADVPTYHDTGFKLTLNRATGMFTGTFTAPDGTKPVFNGVVVNKSSATQCEGFFLTPAPKVKDYTGQSGYVVLFATP